LILDAEMPATSRSLRELEVKTQTGALVVGIGREGQSTMINPGGFEVLHPGDKLMLFGNPSQLEDAMQLLSGGTEHVPERAA